MSHGDGLSPQLAAEGVEPFVTQGAGGHLRGDAVLAGIVGRVEIDATEGEAERFGGLSGKVGVGIGLVGAQAKVAMGCYAGVPESGEEVQQGDRVGATTQSDDDGRRGSEQLVLRDVGLDGGKHGLRGRYGVVKRELWGGQRTCEVVWEANDARAKIDGVGEGQ